MKGVFKGRRFIKALSAGKEDVIKEAQQRIQIKLEEKLYLKSQTKVPESYKEKFYKVLDQRSFEFKSKEKKAFPWITNKPMLVDAQERSIRLKAFTSRERSIEQHVTSTDESDLLRPSRKKS